MVSFLPASIDRRWALKRQKSITFNLPPPTGGLNARDSFTGMKPEDAVIMTNVFPEANDVVVRGGHSLSSTGMTNPVRSLMTWNGLTGVDKIFAGAGTTIWDISTATATSTGVTGLANVDFQWTNIKTPGGMYLIYVNGANSMGAFDGTNWTNPAITVATSSTFANVLQFKERLWFAQKDTLDAWYLGVQSIAGVATLFPLGSVFHRGGFLIGLGTFSNDAGEGPDDYMCFISSNGEVAVYAGTDPSSSTTWALVGRFDVGMPIGRRCAIRWNGDLGILTQDGVISMQAALRFDRASGQKASITAKIQTLFSQFSGSYKTNFGWMQCVYPKQRYLIVNVPAIADMSQSQLVMNTITGQWCQFSGFNAGCWGVANDLLYFGGNSGSVYQANVGFLDLGAQIPWEVASSWQMMGGATNKSFTMVSPTMLVGSGVTYGVTVNVDFESIKPAISLQALAPVGTGMTWAWTWPGTWGGSSILDHRWQTTAGYGTWSSVHMAGAVQGGACAITSFEMIGERGGPL